MKQKAAAGHAKKHTGTKKHAASAKHHPASKPAHHAAKTAHAKTAHAKAKHPAHTKARALSIGDVSCCAADALAWSLRLAGWPVADEDVLALYKLTADSPDTGASILATLDAASVFGLAGVRPVSFEARELLIEVPVPCGVRFPVVDSAALAGIDSDDGSAPGARNHRHRDGHPSSLILGLELPGPHAVCQQDGQWWTWGEPYDPCCFPDAVIEEAWAVTWP